MSDIQVESSTYHIDASAQEQQIIVDAATNEVTIVVPGISSLNVTKAGPVGPPGSNRRF